MDNFHSYIKKQLIEYVEAERKKGIPVEHIEKILLDAGHGKNIIDEVFLELEKEEIGGKKLAHKDPVEMDLIAQLKKGFEDFMAKASKKEVKEAQKDLKKTDTDKVVEEVIQEAEVIEEKIMLEAFVFFVYLIGMALVILFTAGSTDAEIVKVILGFSPVIINSFLSLVAVKLADNAPLYIFVPLILSSVFYSIGTFTKFAIFQGFEMEGLAIVNFLFGFLFNIMIVYVRFIKPAHLKERLIKPAKMAEVRKHNLERKEEKLHDENYYSEHKVDKKGIDELRKEFKL